MNRLHAWAIEQPFLRVFTIAVRVLLVLAFDLGAREDHGRAIYDVADLRSGRILLCRFLFTSGVLLIRRSGSMGRRWSVAHSSHGDARRAAVPAHHREHLRDYRCDWTGVRRDARNHRCDADRERLPPLLGLGSVEADSSARNTSQSASRRSDDDCGNDVRGRRRILGRNTAHLARRRQGSFAAPLTLVAVGAYLGWRCSSGLLVCSSAPVTLTQIWTTIANGFERESEATMRSLIGGIFVALVIAGSGPVAQNRCSSSKAGR